MSMKFINFDFPPGLFLPKSGVSTGGFIADVLPEEKIETTGYFYPPMFWYEDENSEKNKESQHNDENRARVLQNNLRKDEKYEI